MVSGIGQAAKNPHYMKAHFSTASTDGPSPTQRPSRRQTPPWRSSPWEGTATVRRGRESFHPYHQAESGSPTLCSTTGLTASQRAGFTHEPEGIPHLRPGGRGPCTALQPSGSRPGTGSDLRGPGLRRKRRPDKGNHQEGRPTQGIRPVDIFQPCVSFNSVNTYKVHGQHLHPGGHEEEDSARPWSWPSSRKVPSPWAFSTEGRGSPFRGNPGGLPEGRPASLPPGGAPEGSEGAAGLYGR